MMIFVAFTLITSHAGAATNKKPLQIQAIMTSAWGDSNIGCDTNPKLKLYLRNIDRYSYKFALNWQLSDIEGKVLDSGKFDVNLKAISHQEIPLSVTLPGFGWYQITLEIPATEKYFEFKKTMTLASVPHVKRNGYDRNSPFGVNGHNNLYYPLLRQLGVSMSRVDADWPMLEKPEGHWNWYHIDNLIQESKDNGVLLFAIIGYNPEWLKFPAGKGTDHQKFLNYVRQTVNHFKDSIFYWDLWNEPQYTWTGSKEEFGQLMYQAYQIIKEIQPNATVNFNAFPFEGTMHGYTLDNLKPLNGKLPFDTLGVHPYSRPKSPDEIDYFFHMTEMKKWINENAPDRELWISELGWETANDAQGVSELLQAAYLVRSLVMGLAAGAKKYIWYQPYSGPQKEWGEDNYGFLDVELQPKPAAAAYAWTSYQLHDAKYREEIKLGRSIRCFSFNLKDHDVIYLWAVKDPVVLQLPCGLPPGTELTRIDGSTMPEEPLTLVAGELPAVILLPTAQREKLAETLRKAKLKLKEPVAITGMIAENDLLRLRFENRNIKQMEVTLEVTLPKGMKFQNEKLNKKTPARLNFTIPGSEKEINLKVKYQHLPLNEQIRLVVQTESERSTAIFPVNIEVAHYLPPFKLDGNLSRWQKFTPIVIDNFNNIGPVDMQKDWKGSPDLSAKAWFGWNEQGLLLAAEVNDDTHRNNQIPVLVWNEDSIQMAADLTQNDMIPVNYGKMSAEISAGLTSNGVITSVNYGNGNAKPAAAIVRNGNKTNYEILFPWSLLGTNQAPAAGTLISAGFIVNDRDGADLMTARKWLGLVPGNIIGQYKNPALFPRVQLQK